MQKPQIAFAALGGTISMTPDADGGITSKIGAQELLQQVPELARTADISTYTLQRLASCSLTFTHLFDALRWAREQTEHGADGIVISQGTDTIEQSAYFFDLFWDRPQPLVVIGAMRGAAAVGFDGAANLLAGVQCAAAAESRNRGVLAVLNDEIHAARFVRKSHATALQTFVSPLRGPCGAVLEGEVRYFYDTVRHMPLPVPADYRRKVFLFEHSLDDDGAAWVDYARAQGAGGLVVNGVGAGHVAENMVAALAQAAAEIPVIICSRTFAGSTTFNTYGYPGSEIDLQARGALMGGYLPAVKARLLLSALLWQGAAREDIAAAVAAHGAGV